DVGRIMKLLDRVGVWGLVIGGGVVGVLATRALMRRRRAASAPDRAELVVPALLVDVVATAPTGRADRAA
ncbi:MAG TPA: hypothetical protein VLA14_05265, partial [Polyangia bacterium]|nr:hypothetical protein [Polyangia bacterium]